MFGYWVSGMLQAEKLPQNFFQADIGKNNGFIGLQQNSQH